MHAAAIAIMSLQQPNHDQSLIVKVLKLHIHVTFGLENFCNSLSDSLTHEWWYQLLQKSH